MRIIKFRAWHIRQRAMYPVVSINFTNGLVELKNKEATLSSIKLMQFTGLKDKNGKEIYEGDIVEDNSGQRIVQGLCCAEKVIREPRSCTNNYEWREVIGNIYEENKIALS